MAQPQSCFDCGKTAPETQTSYTLISSAHGWRVSREKNDAGEYVAVSPNGQFVFTDSDDAITTFTVTEGSSTPLAATSCASEPDVGGCPALWPNNSNSDGGPIVVSPVVSGNQFLYFDGDGMVEWLSVNPSTGALSDPGTATPPADCLEDVNDGTGDGCPVLEEKTRSGLERDGNVLTAR